MSPDSQLLLPEEKLLLFLCRLDFDEEMKAVISLLVKEIKDWPHFVNLANDHGVIAFCWYNLTISGVSNFIPVRFLEILHSAYLKNLTRNTFLYCHLEEIVTLAKKENIKIVLLKGLVLERTVYGNNGLRQIGDIDILVDADKAIPLRKILLENGFKSLLLISPLHKKILPYLRNHLPAMEKKGIFVEIHVRLFEQEGNSLTEELFTTAYKISEKGYEIFYPQLQIFFLYLVKHLDRHEKTKHLQLKSFTDLGILVTHYQDQILNKQLFDLARRAGLVTALNEKLKLLEIFWNISFPEWVKEYIGKTNSELITKKFIRFVRYPENYQTEEKSVALIKPLKEIPGIIYKTLFIVGYLFPSPGYLKYRYKAKTMTGILLCYPVRWINSLWLIIGR
jgi:hypothetical protein